jgi:hypothetical protein
MRRKEKGTDCGRRPAHLVFLLLDAAGAVGAVGVRRTDAAPVGPSLWSVREYATGRLGAWLRGLQAEPGERVIIGLGAGLHTGTAWDIAKTVAGWWHCPLIGEDRTPGRPRVTATIRPDGTIQTWNSQAEAGKALGLSRWATRRRLGSGTVVDLGPARGKQRPN